MNATQILAVLSVFKFELNDIQQNLTHKRVCPKQISKGQKPLYLHAAWGNQHFSCSLQKKQTFLF